MAKKKNSQGRRIFDNIGNYVGRPNVVLRADTRNMLHKVDLLKKKFVFPLHFYIEDSININS